MRFLRNALVSSLLLAAPACGGGDAAAPVVITASGSWSGALLTGGGLNMTLVENASKTITGAGSLTFGATSLPIQVLGTDTFPKVRLVLQSNGFESAIFTGTLTATSLRGALNGSGFVGDSVILAKN